MGMRRGSLKLSLWSSAAVGRARTRFRLFGLLLRLLTMRRDVMGKWGGRVTLSGPDIPFVPPFPEDFVVTLALWSPRCDAGGTP